MAQTNYTPILIYASGTTGNTPSASNLTSSASGSELALNYFDGKLFYKDASGNVQVLATKGGVGSSTTTQVLYNSSGSLAGSANMTFNGTTLTLANDASISGLTVGKGGGSVSTNTAVGASALTTNSTGANNTAVGYVAAYYNTGVSNSAFGSNALRSNTTGQYNYAGGAYALESNTTGSSNVGIGYGALDANTTASNNTAVGYQAGYSGTTAANTVSVGYQSNYLNQTNNICVGIGYQANYSNTGGNPIAIGYQAGYYQSSGSYNIALGHQALYGTNGTSTGGSNTAVGHNALYSNTTANDNTAVGYQALYSNLTGGDNVALGYQAGFACTYALNVFVGKASGAGMTSGYYNIYVGPNSNASSGGVNNEVVLGYGLNGKGASTSYIQGSAYQTTNSAAWSITSDQRLKKNIVDNTVGLTAINGIKVRNFEYRLPDEITDLDKSNAVEITGVQLGPIAQELQQVLPDCVKTESTGVMSVDSSDVLWHLVTAVQQLSAQVTALQAKVGV